MQGSRIWHKYGSAVYLSLLAFCTYSCMYAFRKPFTVATFEGLFYLGIHYKIWLITSQVIGYTASKFIGIKVISEVKSYQRLMYILVFIGIAWLALVGFALIPSPYNIIFLLLNGFPLGMIWGLVFSYVEGRKLTDFFLAVLCTSFIFASGLVKTIGKFLMVHYEVSEFWMPAVTGLIFLFPIFVFAYLLDRYPAPAESDKLLRSERGAMTGPERRAVFYKFAPGIVAFVLVYMFLTSFRDFRDNFMAEIWINLGVTEQPGIFTATEIPVALLVLIIMASLVKIQSNRKAFLALQFIIIVGLLLTGGSTLFFHFGMISPFVWMVAVGTGLYMSYIPFNGIIFDRLVAAFKQTGTAGFLVYVADSFGYLGSTGILLFKNFGHAEMSFLDFFKWGAIVLSVIGILVMLFSFFYFNHLQKVPSIIPVRKAYFQRLRKLNLIKIRE